MNSPMYRCPICQRLYSNQRSLKIHLPPCRQKVVVEDSHHQIDHHPLRSFHNNVDNNETSLNNDDYFCGDCDDNIDYEAGAMTMTVLSMVVTSFPMHPSPLMMNLIIHTSSIMITKKHNNNRVQQRQSYKSSSTIWLISTKYHSNYMMT